MMSRLPVTCELAPLCMVTRASDSVDWLPVPVTTNEAFVPVRDRLVLASWTTWLPDPVRASELLFSNTTSP